MTDPTGAMDDPKAATPTTAELPPAGPDAVRIRVHPSTRQEGDEDVTIDAGAAAAPAAAHPGRAEAGQTEAREVSSAASEVGSEAEIAALRWLDGSHATYGTGESTHHILLEPAGPLGANGRREREVVVDGWRFVLEVEPERLARLREKAARGSAIGGHGGPLEVRAIIPGRVVGLLVAVGDEVHAGQHLLIVEAMKMQNELRAPRAGVVDRIVVGAGETVDLGTLLLVLR